MNKKGFVLSATVYSLFGIMLIVLFYILYILTASRTTVTTITKAVEAEVNAEPMATEIQKVFDYGFTGDYQIFTVPITGRFKVQVWGANGSYNNNDTTCGTYIKGEIDLVKDTKLYVYVGQAGGEYSTGYNGAGLGGEDSNIYASGATDIRTKPGSYRENLDNRIIIAGGAGGTVEYYNSQDWTDRICEDRYCGRSGKIISKSSAGFCTQDMTNDTHPDKLFGENGINVVDNPGSGGGGWYGGIATNNAQSGSHPGYGGSSYIASDNWCADNKICIDDNLITSLNQCDGPLLDITTIDNYNFIGNTIEMKDKTNVPTLADDSINDCYYGNGRVRITYCDGVLC